MKEFDWYYMWLILLVIVGFVGLFILMTPLGDNEDIYRTYEESFKISHMGTAGKHFVISARNDNDSFSITVDPDVYAKYIVGEILHVKVTVYEKDNKYYKGYEIMGREGYV